MIKRRRVVITGLGCITAIGESAEDMFNAVCRAESGISNIEAFDVKDFAVRFGGEVKDFQKGLVKNGAPSSAVGKYQFISKTLKLVQREMGLDDSVIFSSATQDAMIMHRLKKTRGLDDFKNGTKSAEDMNNSFSLLQVRNPNQHY